MYQYFDVNPDRPAVVTPNYSLVSHQQTQTVRYQCSRCDSLFTSRIFLHEHEASMHNRIFHCPFCPVLFSNKPDYQTHVLAHSEKKYLPCAFCKKVFDQLDDYAVHMKEHREQCMFPCDKCPALFGQYSKLRAHHAIHVQQKFIHNIPEVSDFLDCSRKKFSKKILKKLKSKSKTSAVKNQERRPTFQTTDSAVPVVSASVDSVPVIFPPDPAPDVSFDDNEVIERSTKTVRNSNREKNIRKRGHFQKKTNLTSEASTSTCPVSVPSTSSSSSSENVAPTQSAAKPITKNVLPKRKCPPKKNCISAPSTSNELDNQDESVKINSKRNLRPKNTLKSLYDEGDDSEEIISAPPTSNELNETDSILEVNSKRNLRPRNTLKCFNRGFSIIKSRTNYNLRRRAEGKSLYVESSLSAESNNKTEKPTSSSSRTNTSIGFFMCLSCKRLFSTYRLLNQHKDLHFKNKGFRCSGCGGLFGGAGNLAFHQKSSLCVST